MTTFIKRATHGQKLIYRVVNGAIRDASHAHPDRAVSKTMARSISKRAAGTLAALSASALAGRSSSSERADGTSIIQSAPLRADSFHPGSEGEGGQSPSPVEFDDYWTMALR